MRRLFLTIYLAMLGIIVMSVVVMATLIHVLDADQGPVPHHVRLATSLLVNSLDPEDLDGDLRERARELDVQLALYDADKVLIAGTPDQPIGPCAADCGHGTFRVGTWGRGARVRLEDGRWLVVTMPFTKGWGRRARGLLIVVGVFGMVTGIASLPIARRITRRLERLARGVDRWGKGDLATRVPVEGTDEIADLAERFNDAAQRVESLVASQRRMLAYASHELRTPLARIRMALALIEDGEPIERWAREAHEDVGRLDELIDVLLTSVRLDDTRGHLAKTRFDLTALAAEVAARRGMQIAASRSLEVDADRALIERVLVNLVDNALRHGKPPVRIELSAEDGQACVSVDDAGSGVLVTARQRIFEPFERNGSSKAGSGLGLALVRRVLDAHGGEVRCVDSRGGGARFEVRIPMPEAAATSRVAA